MRYASSRYGNWRSVIGHGHGYKDGTLSVVRNMFAPLSEDGRPEIVAGPQMGNLMKGSRVYNGDETEQILRLRTIAQPKKVSSAAVIGSAGASIPDTLIVKDVDDKLVGRMRVEGYGAAIDAQEDRESMMARIGA
jgi:SLT domain-containing protein